MTDGLRAWIQWAIVLFFVFLPAWLCRQAAAEILYWVVTCAQEILNQFQVPFWIKMKLHLIILHGAIFAYFLVAGFAYCWLMGTEWRKSALVAWLLFAAVDNVSRVPNYGITLLATAGWFYAELSSALIASLVGAWLGREHRHNPKLVAVRDMLFNTVVIYRD